MAEGDVKVAATVSNLNTDIPTARASEILGGFRSVASTAVRDAIPAEMREEGMRVKVVGGNEYELAADLTTWNVVSGGGGSGLPDVANVDGYAIIEVGGVYASRPILASYIVAAFDITGFSTSMTTREVGQAATTPAFTATFNRTPTAATLTNNSDAESKNVVGTPTSFSSSNTFTSSTNNASVTFTLTASEGGNTDTATTSVAWRPRVYYGATAVVVDTEVEIEALASSALASSRAATLSLTAGSGEYLFYAFPSSYGTPTFTVGGFSGGFSLVASAVSVTNAYGVTQNYDVWRSDNPNLGSVSVVVT